MPRRVAIVLFNLGGPDRPEAHPVRHDPGATQPRLDRRAVSHDALGRGRVGFQAPVAPALRAAEDDGLAVRKQVDQAGRPTAEPDEELCDAGVLGNDHLPPHRHQFKIRNEPVRANASTVDNHPRLGTWRAGSPGIPAW